MKIEPWLVACSTACLHAVISSPVLRITIESLAATCSSSSLMPVGTVLFSLPKVSLQLEWSFFKYSAKGFWKFSVKNGANSCSITAIFCTFPLDPPDPLLPPDAPLAVFDDPPQAASKLLRPPTPSAPNAYLPAPAKNSTRRIRGLNRLSTPCSSASTATEPSRSLLPDASLPILSPFLDTS